MALTPPADDGDRLWTVDAQLARITVRQSRETVLVRIDGEMDASNTTMVKAALADAVAAPGLSLVVDLSGVEFIDSSSVSLLLLVARELEHRRWTFRVVAPPGAQVRRVLELMGIGGTSVSDTVDDALDIAH